VIIKGKGRRRRNGWSLKHNVLSDLQGTAIKIGNGAKIWVHGFVPRGSHHFNGSWISPDLDMSSLREDKEK
jgi:hypothetical protein